MCTALTFSTDDNYRFLSRTMDFSFELNAKPTFIPKNYHFKSQTSDNNYSTTYSFIGTGEDLNGFMFADGFNEKGFSIASLYFENNAVYSENHDVNKLELCSTDLVSWSLGNVSSVTDFENKIDNIQITNAKNALLNIVVPLHWIVSDSSGKVGVFEITKSGNHFYLDDVGVLTNSPEFPWHLTNLNHYINLQPTEFSQKKYGSYKTVSDGPGSGALGLPGDYTAVSRFIRTAFLKQYSTSEISANSGLIAVMHILNSVDIPKGVKETSDLKNDYTQYKSIMNLTDLKYSFQAYDDTTLYTYTLTPDLINSDKVKIFNS